VPRNRRRGLEEREAIVEEKSTIDPFFKKKKSPFQEADP